MGQDGDSDADYDDEDDDEGDKYIKQLSGRLTDPYVAMKNAGFDDEYDDEDDEDEWGVPDLDEDPFFLTVLDQVNPYIVFENLMKGLPGERQSELVSVLAPELRGVLEVVVAEAGKAKLENAKSNGSVPIQ